MPEKYSQDLINEITKVLAKNGIGLDWKVYLIIALMSILGSLASQWMGSYFRKKGETLATKSDMTEILNQLSASTKTVEETKSAILMSDWIAREWRAIRRTKLEELLSTAHSLNKWNEQSLQYYIFEKGEPPDNTPLATMRMLSQLYFPELINITRKLNISQQEINILFIDTKMKGGTKSSDPSARKTKQDNLFNEWSEKYKIAQELLLEFEFEASKLMQIIMTKSPD